MIHWAVFNRKCNRRIDDYKIDLAIFHQMAYSAILLDLSFSPYKPSFSQTMHRVATLAQSKLTAILFCYQK